MKTLVWLIFLLFVEINGENKRIIGGESAEDITDFPYQVMVTCEHGNKLIVCGGALVWKNKVVTAAHCVKGCKLDNLKVTAGVLSSPDSVHEHAIRSSHPHPKYSDKGVDNDIAVLCLVNNLKEGARIRHINLASKQPKPGTKAVVSGWGMTEDEPLARDLVYAEVTVVDGNKCKKENPYFDDNQICTDSDGVGPCKGDSGGPLVANNELIGVVSYGNVDCQANYVRMYTNVYRYKSFVNKIKC